jgi:DsbC/DsbD-like thiol-disulfide interchange protein
VSYSQDTSDKVVNINLSPVTKTIKTGSLVELDLLVNIKEGWHINSDKPLDPNMVPTVVSLRDTSVYKIKNIKYPLPHIKKLAFSENELSLYEDAAAVKIQLIIDKNYNKKNININGEIQYQPCNDQTCLFPFTKSFSANLKITENK